MICPKCKAEIDADSLFCDQCGQELRYCSSCSKPGKGNRCTFCGGKMISATERFAAQRPVEMNNIIGSTITANFDLLREEHEKDDQATLVAPSAPSRLTLFNEALGISIEGVDGAIIGRRKGAYQQQLAAHPYVSGAHVQINYDAALKKWTLTDMNSSNGSKYNGMRLTAGIPCLLSDGGVLQLANVVLNVTVK